MGEIKVEVPEGMPLDEMKKKILKLVKEEEAKMITPEKSLDREARKKILDKYYGIIKLDRTVSIDEILELEEEAWQY